MINTGKSDTATLINLPNGTISIWPTTIWSGTIRVANAFTEVLWQKNNCTAEDISYALEVLKRGIQTNVFETDSD